MLGMLPVLPYMKGLGRCLPLDPVLSLSELSDFPDTSDLRFSSGSDLPEPVGRGWVERDARELAELVMLTEVVRGELGLELSSL